jgi:hypothetical protein
MIFLPESLHQPSPDPVNLIQLFLQPIDPELMKA